jgi:hypothetical protein
VDGSPETGTVSARYAEGLAKLARSPNAFSVPQTLLMSCDIVRARNRAVRIILEHEFNATHVLWWDEDVDPGPHVHVIVNALIQSGHDIVGAPYPMKSERGGIPIIKHQAELPDPVDDCVPVAALGFGFMLTSRRALEHMVKHYDDLWFYDVQNDGSYHRTIGLFDLSYQEQAPIGFEGPWRERLSEDYSFCLRALKCGLQPHMYVGLGTPLAHIGRIGYRFKGPWPK